MLLELTAHLLTRDSRQTQVQHHRSRRAGPEHFHGSVSVRGDLYVVAFSLEKATQGFLHRTVIFNHENTIPGAGTQPLWKFLQSRLRCWQTRALGHPQHMSSPPAAQQESPHLESRLLLSPL